MSVSYMLGHAYSLTGCLLALDFRRQFHHISFGSNGSLINYTKHWFQKSRGFGLTKAHWTSHRSALNSRGQLQRLIEQVLYRMPYGSTGSHMNYIKHDKREKRDAKPKRRPCRPQRRLWVRSYKGSLNKWSPQRISALNSRGCCPMWCCVSLTPKYERSTKYPIDPKVCVYSEYDLINLK